MKSVVIKGGDIDTAVRLETVDINLDNSANSAVHLPQIEMLGDACTYQRVNVRKTIMGQAFLRFHQDLKHFYSSVAKSDLERQDNRTVYPQKHIRDIFIYGANGQSGMLPSYSYINTGNLLDYVNGSCPADINSIFDIYTVGGSSINDWNVCEHGWWERTPKSGDDGFEITESEMYTRGSDLMSALGFSGAGGTRDNFKTLKCLNMFYSDKNMVIIRMTIEILDDETKNVTFERFTGGESLS